MGVKEDGITANTIKLEHIVELNTQADMNVEFISLETTVGRQYEVPNLGNNLGNYGDEGAAISVTANTKGPISFSMLVYGESSRKNINFRTLVAPAGNGADVAIPLEFIRATSEGFSNSAYGLFLGKRMAYPIIANYFGSKDGLDAMLKNGSWLICNNLVILKNEDGLSVNATILGTPLMLDSYTSDMCMQSCDRSSFARAMIELRADVKLKDTIVVVMPKLVGEGFYMCTICVECEWKPPRCSSCKVVGHVLDECPRKIVSNVVKNLKTPKQGVRGVQWEKMQAKLSSQKVSNSNPFDSLNCVENDDDDLGTNGGNSKSAGKGSLYVAYGSYSNTLIIEKIHKLERQILIGKLTFVDNDGNPLYMNVPKGNKDSESEMEVVFDETANLISSTSLKGGIDSGYGTNGLLEQ
ncbi:hypothetical protein Tco_0005111 [Tanacetum coccineum]